MLALPVVQTVLQGISTPLFNEFIINWKGMLVVKQVNFTCLVVFNVAKQSTTKASTNKIC